MEDVDAGTVLAQALKAQVGTSMIHKLKLMVTKFNFSKPSF